MVFMSGHPEGNERRKTRRGNEEEESGVELQAAEKWPSHLPLLCSPD